MSDQLLNAKEAAALLGVSFPTFKKICKQHGLTGIKIGSRIKFSKAELLSIIGKPHQVQGSLTPSLDFTVFSDYRISSFEVQKGIFDLRSLKVLDPYGVVSLLCTLINRCRSGQNIELLIEDNKLTQYLRSINFFQELEAECLGKIGWDNTLLKSKVNFVDEDVLVPVRGIKLKGGERIIAEKLIELLKQQGFSITVGRKIAHIIGELADNALTHSNAAIGERSCYILARRFLIGNKNSVIVGLADTGQGIHTSLKGKEKYKGFPDDLALLEAFRPYVSSWDDSANRGKGLADVLGIAWGNNSYLRVDSGEFGLFMDFSKGPTIKFRSPAAIVNGTRYGIVLIDNEFEKRDREQVDNLIQQVKKDM